MSSEICKFVLDNILYQTLKIGHALGYFQIWEHLCALVDDNFNLTTKILFYMTKHLIWMNITSYAYD
jgi:hypothetical protein